MQFAGSRGICSIMFFEHVLENDATDLSKHKCIETDILVFEE